MISFPVLTRLSVAGYQLYPGNPPGRGLEHDFISGVNVVVGINGIGKTTLLNMLLRLLSGDREVRADGELGQGRRELTPTGTRYFANRVGDRAKIATATCEVAFGKNFLQVTRRLDTLAVTEIRVNGQKVNPPTGRSLDDEFKKQVLAASGVSNFYDFVLLLQFLLFFLEDRQALIWDEEAQSEVLRILFYESEHHARYTELYNSIGSLDSEFRNTRAVRGRLDKRLWAEKGKVADSATNDRLRDLDSIAKSLSEKRDMLEQQLMETDERRVGARQLLETSKVTLEELRRERQEISEEFYRTFFPEIDDVARYLLANIESGHGCLICGSTDRSALNGVIERAHKSVCPLCSSSIAKHGTQSRSEHEKVKREMEDLDGKIEKLRSDIESITKELGNLNVTHREILGDFKRVSDDLAVSTADLAALTSATSTSSAYIESLQQKLKSFQEHMLELKATQAEAEREFAELVEKGEHRVSLVVKKVGEKFRECVSAFLAEDCSLNYKASKRRIGQEAGEQSFGFPLFSVRMTSGTFANVQQIRHDSTDVSESQKEFIDLAFRMSLVAVAAEGQSTTIVLETPEASLDSVFVARAGRFLRSFAESGKGLGNRLIVSSNLNKEAMIPALLGVISEEEAEKHAGDARSLRRLNSNSVPRNERKSRLLDLINVAAPNASLKLYGDEYRAQFRKAVEPPWEPI